MNRLVIIILNWNGAEDTLRAVHSIVLKNKSDKILVVDNGSKHADYVKLSELKDLPYVETIKNARNLGFAGGVNTGIRWAIKNNYAFTGLLNNDAEVDKGWADTLLAIFNKDSAISISTGLLLNSSGKKIDSTSEQYSVWGMPFPRHRGLNKQSAPDSGYVFGATGGATLYRTSLFQEIGLFDETFFAYYEDVDISFRAQLAGHKVYYSKGAIAYHKQGASSKKIPGFTVYQMFKNTPLLYTKNVPSKLLVRIGVRFWLTYALMFLNAVKNGSGWPAIKGFIASTYYFWTSALWKRFHIQRIKHVSADYVLSILFHDLPPGQTGMRRFRKVFTRKL